MVSVFFIVLCFSLQNCSPFRDVSVKGCIIWSSIDSIPLTYREKRMSGAILRMRPCKSKPRHGTIIITPCTGSCRQKFSAVLPVSSLYVYNGILHDFQSLAICKALIAGCREIFSCMMWHGVFIFVVLYEE